MRGCVLTPQIKRAPCCINCGRPYSVRFRDNVVLPSSEPFKMLRRWIWMRDCEPACRKEEPRPIVEERSVKVDMLPRKAAPARRPRSRR